MILKISIEKLNVNMYTNDLRLGFQDREIFYTILNTQNWNITKLYFIAEWF